MYAMVFCTWVEWWKRGVREGWGGLAAWLLQIRYYLIYKKELAKLFQHAPRRLQGMLLAYLLCTCVCLCMCVWVRGFVCVWHGSNLISWAKKRRPDPTGHPWSCVNCHVRRVRLLYLYMCLPPPHLPRDLRQQRLSKRVKLFSFPHQDAAGDASGQLSAPAAIGASECQERQEWQAFERGDAPLPQLSERLIGVNETPNEQRRWGAVKEN